MGKNLHLRYLTANEEDQKWGIKVNFVVSQEINPGEVYPPGGHPHRYLFNTVQGRVLNEYQLSLITHGSGYFLSKKTKRFGRQRITEGDVFMLFPGEWHTYAPNSDSGWEEISIGFEGPIMDGFVENGFFTPDTPIISIWSSQEVRSLFDTAIQIAEKQESGYQQLLAGIIIHILGLISFNFKNSPFKDSNVSEKIATAKAIIATEYKSIDGQELARRLNMGYSNFRRLFKNYTGFSPGRYITEIKLSKAKELLTNTDYSVKEISYELGVENYDYFTTSFRLKTGYTPLEYRAYTKGFSI